MYTLSKCFNNLNWTKTNFKIVSTILRVGVCFAWQKHYDDERCVKEMSYFISRIVIYQIPISQKTSRISGTYWITLNRSQPIFLFKSFWISCFISVWRIFNCEIRFLYQLLLNVNPVLSISFLMYNYFLLFLYILFNYLRK